MPTRAYIPAKVTGPDGKRVGADKIAVTWPLRLAGSTALDISVDGAPQARINVNAPATEQLPAGEYTVELSVDRLTARQTFNVSGPPAEVALSEPPDNLSVRDSFTVSATITDAGGAPVPDGTPVSWSATPIAAASTLVETASQRRTINGKAEATWLVVAPGRTTLRAAAGEITSVALVEVAGPPAPPVRLLDQLAAPYTQGSNIWFGTFSIRASALLRELPNAEVVHIWQSNRWYRYSQVEARAARSRSTSRSTPTPSSGSATTTSGRGRGGGTVIPAQAGTRAPVPSFLRRQEPAQAVPSFLRRQEPAQAGMTEWSAGAHSAAGSRSQHPTPHLTSP